MKSERGAWRSIHEVLVDSPEYLALSPPAKLVLFTLKMRLGSLGIAVIPAPVASLAEGTGLTQPQTQAAMAELTTSGWVRTEGSMIWLVNGLKYEPGYSPKNKFHLQKIEKLLAALPRVPLVQEFKNYYAAYLGIEPVDASPNSGNSNLSMPEPKAEIVKIEAAKAKAISWVAEGVAWWCEHVGHINHGRFGTALKPLVDRFGWARVFPSLQEYATSSGAQVRIEWFASNGVRLIEKSKALHRPAWEQEQYDKGMNNQARVMQAVQEYKQTLNGKGEEWWEQMKREAKAKNRYAMVYAYEQLPPREPRHP